MDKNIQSYNDTVEEYYQNTKNLEAVEVNIRNEFLSQLPKGGLILDLACGPGRDIQEFIKRGFQAQGIDASPKMIEKAKEIAPYATYQIMDMRDLNLPKEKYDGIWYNGGLLVIEKKHAPKIIQDLYKTLKPDGILYLSVKQGEGEGYSLDKRYNKEKYFAYYNKQELQNLLKTFEIIETFETTLEGNYHQHPWIQFLCRKSTN